MNEGGALSIPHMGGRVIASHHHQGQEIRLHEVTCARRSLANAVASATHGRVECQTCIVMATLGPLQLTEKIFRLLLKISVQRITL